MPYLTIIGGVFLAWLLLALLFTPHIPYHVEAPIDARSDHFVWRRRPVWEKLIGTVALDPRATAVNKLEVRS